MRKNKLINRIGAIIHRRSPDILLATGIAGVVTTVTLAVRATPKALVLLEREKEHRENNQDGEPCELTPIETVKVAWKCYIPAALTGAGSIACLIFAHSANARRNAALTAAYTLSETALKEYQEKVVETIGEKKEQSIRDTIDKDHVAANPVTNQQVFITEKGDTLCYDHWSGRYFMSDIEKIRKAANDLNKRMLDEMYIPLNDFYYELGLPNIPLGDELGWNVNRNGLVEPRFSAQIAEDGRPCIVLGYLTEPRYDYLK